jgi:alpha 1,2-mannosyltransferase
MKNVIYGASESHRHMCRFQSGFFYRHPLLDGLEFYWRLEPGTRLLCDVDYDPFQLMADKHLKYRFTLSIGEYEKTVPTLWNTTMQFVDIQKQKEPTSIQKQKEPTFNKELLNFFRRSESNTYNLVSLLVKL